MNKRDKKRKTLTDKLLEYFDRKNPKTLDGFIDKYPDRKDSIYVLANRLARRGLLEKKKERDSNRLKSFFRLKDSDEDKGSEKKQQSQEWDGSWRLLVFDVPEEERELRDFLRNELKKRGFYMMQYSVWVTPYPVDEELEQVIQEIGANYYVRLMVLKEIDKEDDLLNYFQL